MSNAKDLIIFLSTRNTIEIRNEDDFDNFIKLLESHTVIDEVLPNAKSRKYDYWVNLVTINSNGKFDLVFEFDAEKGITFYTDRTMSVEWYGKEPIILTDKEDTCFEWCPKCENEVRISTEGVSKCPICGRSIKPCSMCDMNEVNCSKCKITKKVK